MQEKRILLGFQNVFLQTELIERTIMSQHFISHPESPRSGGRESYLPRREPNNVFFLCLVVSL